MGLYHRVAGAISGLLEETIPDPPVWDSFGRIGGGLSPGELSQILREADIGQIARLVDLTHEARQKDGHLHAIMQTREIGLQGLDFDVVAPGDEPDEADKEVASKCKRALEQCATFPTTIGHLNGESVLFGHSHAEIVWKLDDEDDELRGMLVPDYFKRISCRRFGFATADGSLLYNPNAGSYSSVDQGGIDLLDEYPVGKFLSIKGRRINGDVEIREGLARVLMWSALFRNWDIRDWLQLGEIGWKPRVVGKYAKGAAKEDITALQRAVQAFISSTKIVLPEGSDLMVEWPKNAGPVMQSLHHELAEFLGMEMSKAVLGQTLTTESGNKGARSLGDVHNDIRKDIVESDALEVAACIKRYLITPFVKLNYGDRVRVPEFFFLTEDPLDLESFANSIKALREAGLDIGQRYVLDRAGIPEPKADEPLMGDSADGEDAADLDDDDSQDESEEDSTQE